MLHTSLTFCGGPHDSMSFLYQMAFKVGEPDTIGSPKQRLQNSLVARVHSPYCVTIPNCPGDYVEYVTFEACTL